MLSNTATPKYYGEFREKVLRGEIPVCKEILMEMERIEGLIANPNIYYDDEAIDGFIAFCEHEMALDDGTELHMLDTFKLWSEAVYGWYYFVERSVPACIDGRWTYVNKKIKKRLINKQYLIIGRSAAKTLYAACHQAFWLTVDSSPTQQMTTAPTMRQAEETINPIKIAMKQCHGPWLKFLTSGTKFNTRGNNFEKAKLVSTKKGIENTLTQSFVEVRAMSVDSLQGNKHKIATIDEWLSGDVREDVIGAIEQGAAKMGDYLIIATSSEGTVRNAVGDEIKLELMSILKGEYVNPHVSIWYYKLDNVNEVADPSKWAKANPNLGYTVTYETYQLEVERAEKNPAARNDILAKRFGLPMEGYTYFFTYEEIQPHKARSFWGLPCSMGIDLSQGDDFCAFTFLFPLSNGQFGMKTRNYITNLTLSKLPPSLRNEYDKFIEEGTLIVMDGTILHLQTVYDDLLNHIYTSQYEIRSVGYDPYNAVEFIDRWCRENGSFGVVKVPQGARTESVPLGEIKILAGQRDLIFDEYMFKFSMGNCVTIEDTNGNRKLLKKRRRDKIDPVSALIDAYVAYKTYSESYD